MTAASFIFDPLLPWPVIWVLCALAMLLVGIAFWRKLAGWPWRLLALAAALLAVINPSVQNETRDPLTNIVLALVDETASQTIAERTDQTARALADLRAQIEAQPNTELHVHPIKDGPDNAGTQAMQAMALALADIPAERLAGAFIITDGQIHDAANAPALPAPVHLLRTGASGEWDRRLKIIDAPAYAIMGEPVSLTLRIEDQGQVPNAVTPQAELMASVDGDDAFAIPVETGSDITFTVTLPHPGTNIIHLSLPAQPGEITTRNNDAVIQINGIRDRLQVLLVSGEPYAGGRTWRNLLKSDSAVDLVHFTILRPPEKFDNVPVDEMSLIAFPTRELFVEKIEEFDLIVFDRYRRRGLLANEYFSNIRAYVEGGGAILMTTGPEFASANSMFYSAIGPILPVVPTSRVVEAPYLPTVSDLGLRHPVTEGLAPPDTAPEWGRWMRQIELLANRGHVVMTGADDAPLLVLDRVEQGRVAVLASDQAWLWSRGFEGGGPQLELLRRLAHWLMQEPELEEDALQIQSNGQSMTITRRTVDASPSTVDVTAPDGSQMTLNLEQSAPGKFTATLQDDRHGLFRITDGTLTSVAALGPAAPKEFEETIATSEKLAPFLKQQGGGAFGLQDGLPNLRWVAEGRATAGRNWAGLIDRDAFVSSAITLKALLPVWTWLLLAAGLSIFGWLREGRR